MPTLKGSQKISDATLSNATKPWRKMIPCETPSGDFEIINNCISANRPEKLIYAEGDSWFDKFTPIPNSRTNLLQEIRLPFHTVVVDVSTVGDESGDMVKGWQARRTEALFRFGMHGFDAILLSAGGNDLKNLYADKIQLYSADGVAADEIKKMRQPSEYANYFGDVINNIKKFVDFRNNSKNPITQKAPILLHGYDYFQPRPAKAEIFSDGSFGRGPWLYPVLLSAGFNSVQMRSAADAVVDQLNLMLASAITTLPNVHLIDSRGLLKPAAPDTTGETEHWLDEIHPSSAGFEKLARCCWNRPLAELLGYQVQDGDLDAACQTVAVTTALADTPVPTTIVA